MIVANTKRVVFPPFQYLFSLTEPIWAQNVTLYTNKL